MKWINSCTNPQRCLCEQRGLVCTQDTNIYGVGRGGDRTNERVYTHRVKNM